MCITNKNTTKTRKGQKVSFHHLPIKNLERCKQWLRAILKDTAIPSIFTFPDDEQPGPSGTKRIPLEVRLSLILDSISDHTVAYIYSVVVVSSKTAKLAK